MLANTVVVQEDHVPQGRSVFSSTDAGVLILIVRDHPLDISKSNMKYTVLQVHLLGILKLIDPIQYHIQGGISVRFAYLYDFQLGEDFSSFPHAEFAVSLSLLAREIL